MKSVVAVLLGVLAVAAALPAGPVAAPKDDLKASEAVYLASPYVAAAPAAYPAYSAYSALPAYSAYSYGYPSVGYAAAPYSYLYR